MWKQSILALCFAGFSLASTHLPAAEPAGQVAVAQAIDAVSSAVARGDKAAVGAHNQEVSRLLGQNPEWVAGLANMISAVDDSQAPAAGMLAQMSADAQNALMAGDAETAIASQQAALMVAMDTFGPQHGLTITANRELGLIYRQLGMAQEAETYYNAALDSAIGALGEGHPLVLQINSMLAELYGASGLVEEAWLLQESVVAGLTSSLGKAHPQTIEARYEGIYWLSGFGDYPAALAALEPLCMDIAASYGAYHPQAVDCLIYQASTQAALGQLAQQEQTYNQVIERLAATVPSIDGKVFNVMADLAELYRQQGRYQESKDLLSGVIQTALQINNLEAANKAKAYLGRTLKNEGALTGARILTEEVLDYGTRNWLDQPLSIYNTLLELGAIYQAEGKLAEAQATFEEAFEGLTRDAGELHPSTLVAAVNLAQIYEKNGLYDMAEPLLKTTLRQLEANYGPAHPDTLRARNNMALLDESQGNFGEAEPLYLQSLELMEELYGPDYTDVVAVKNNLAYLYMLMEDYAGAATLFEEVQQQWRTLFGPEHQNTLKATNNLGRVYQKMQRLPEAETQIAEALALRQKVLGPQHLDSIRSMIDLGGVYIDELRIAEADTLLTSALQLAESILGNQHPYTFEALNMLARAKEAANNLPAAVALREEGMSRRSVFLDRMLWTTGENAREGYVRLHRPELNAYLALLARIKDPERGKKAIDASLQRKGLLLKVTSEIQQIATLAKDPELTDLAEELKATRKRLAAMTLSGPTAATQGRHAEVLYELEQRVDQLQGEIGRASVRFKTSIAQVSADSLEGVLASDHALIDFLYYEENGEGKVLAAVVVNEGGEFRYELVDYDDRVALDKSISRYREIIQDDLADEDELLEVGLDAYDMVWQPLQDVLGDITDVYLIPDGILNILPFSALVNADDEYLIQTHDVHILSSGRDLLPSGFNLVDGEYVILAGPDYNSTDVVSEAAMKVAMGKRSSTLQVGLRGAGNGLRGLNFAPLPGAEEEGRIINTQVNKSDSVSVEFFGVAAQEQVLTDLKRPPEILHMATHGFFLAPDDSLRKRLLKLQRGADLQIPPPGDNPLLRAGLAFAGINTNAQFLGDIDTINDGVLTALEVLSLNLSGTRLVVLSACETGLGEIHEGEGVYGLRRSFQEAGVAEVISSLWEVSDAGTQALMTGFYDRLLAGQPAREALRDAQLELIDSPQWNYPYVWSAFMIVGSYESAGFKTQ
jgi:CHAT domain-containing protein/tetratricopeptide (TPR) repeat protein